MADCISAPHSAPPSPAKSPTAAPTAAASGTDGTYARAPAATAPTSTVRHMISPARDSRPRTASSRAAAPAADTEGGDDPAHPGGAPAALLRKQDQPEVERARETQLADGEDEYERPEQWMAPDVAHPVGQFAPCGAGRFATGLVGQGRDPYDDEQGQ